jgi:hypothetical protein
MFTSSGVNTCTIVVYIGNGIDLRYWEAGENIYPIQTTPDIGVNTCGRKLLVT